MEGSLWTVEIETEVLDWLETLSDDHYLHVERHVERLLDRPTTLPEPYSRHLGDGLRELRFDLGHDGASVRITYWLAPDRRIVFLTVFRKTKSRETRQVERAQQAKKTCETTHDSAPDHAVYTRDV
jgi:hypothetical protein